MSKIKLKATVFWAQLEDKNDMSGKYQVVLGNLSDAAIAALEGMGCSTLERDDKPDQGAFITCKSSHPIYAKDGDGADLRGIRIGNGSTAIATISAYEWTFKGKKGTSPSLDRLVITDLVFFDGDGEGDDVPSDEEAL